MQPSTPRARIGLLAVAAALTAALVAAPTAGAASVEGGTSKFDFKTFVNAKKLKFKTVGANPNTKTGGTFTVGSGVVTFNEQPSGNVGIGATSSRMEFTLGKRKMSLSAFTFKLTSGKGALNAVVNGKGKAVTLFDVASQGKVGPDSKFAQLVMSTANMQLTRSGAAAVNKALGLTKPKRGKKDPRVKAKQKVGNMSMSADRSLTFVGGQSVTIYDQAFVTQLRDCNIELQAVAPATAIPKDASAPEGGVNLPVNAQAGGTLTASSLIGQVNHLGGTRLFRPAPGQPGNTTGKAEYDSPIEDFRFSFGGNATALFARVLRSNNVLEIGTVEPPIPTAELRDTGGVVTLVGDLVLSATAAGTLAQKEPPLGADCPIPAGSKIGRATMNAQVE